MVRNHSSLLNGVTLMHVSGLGHEKLLLEKINVWRTELHAGGPGGDAPAPAPNAPEVPKMVAAAAPEGKKGEDREQRGTHTIQLTERFICRPGDVFESYTNAHRIMAFTQSRAESEPRVGGRFSMFDGSVEGKCFEWPHNHPCSRCDGARHALAPTAVATGVRKRSTRFS